MISTYVYPLVLTLGFHYAYSSHGGVLVLKQGHQGPHYQEPLLIAHPERVKLEHLVWYLQKKQFPQAFQALRFLPPETFTKQADTLLRKSIEGNDQSFMETVLTMTRECITREKLYHLLNWANNRYCNNSYEGLMNYCFETLPAENVSELRFLQLVLASYNGNTHRAKTELEWSSSSSRSINTPAHKISIASRISYCQSSLHFKKEESHPTHSLLKYGHTLPLNAAVDSSEIEIIHLLLEKGADPCALDHEEESAEMLIAKRLLALDEDQRDLGSDEKLHALWLQERARALEILGILTLYRENTNRDVDKPTISEENVIKENDKANENSLRPDETLMYIHRRALYNKEIREEQEARDAEAAANNRLALSLHLAKSVGSLILSGANLLFFSQ